MSEINWLIKTPAEFICTDNYYLIKGKKYARVTRINSIIDKPELRNWYAKTGPEKSKEILKKRAGFGSTTHKLIEVILSGETISRENYDNYQLESIDEFHKWVKEHDLTVQALEQHLWSEEYKYAGTCDCIAMVDGKLMILDWKTSKGIYDEYFLQMAAYVNAFEELTGIKVWGIGILHIRDGEHNFVTKTHQEMMETYFPVFLHAKALYEWKYPNV
jgi:hypothetical protein